MGYYCTVPQCTSLAGKTKNVKFHRFPRDLVMADKWNNILKRGKPFTKYSKVCSLHFTQADYNISTMGQWKTLNKDAVPTQNLPKLNPDGTVMVIRKSRTVKYKEQRKEDIIADKTNKWLPLNGHASLPLASTPDRTMPPAISEPPDTVMSYRMHKMNEMASLVSPQHAPQQLSPGHSQHGVQMKPKKQDAIMQTDPIQDEDDQNTGYESSERSFGSDQMEQYRQGQYGHKEHGQQQYKDQQQQQQQQQEQFANNRDQQQYNKDGYAAKDYTKPTDDYMPRTNEEYNKEAEKYALERKSHNGYDKASLDYPKQQLSIDGGYQQKLHQAYASPAGKQQPQQQQEQYECRDGYPYHGGYDGQQHNVQMRMNENQNFFNENHIKQEIDFGNEEEKFLYERSKEQIEPGLMYESQRRLLEQLQQQVKQEPDLGVVCDSVMQPQTSPYYNANGHGAVTGGYYEDGSRPGPELLIAKQNALAAHTQLWQNTMKRPFFYSETAHYNAPQLLHRYEDLTRIQQ